MTSAKDMISERYQQENPEGARLVSDEVRSSPRKSGTGSSQKKRKSAVSPKDASGAEKTVKEPAKSAKKSAASPKKPAKSNAKKPDEHQEDYPSVKTPSVLKLVEDIPLVENQVIAAGKSQIPRQLRGIEPLSRVIRREAAQMSEAERVRNSPEVRKDLTQMVIEQNAPEILRRFNACDCDKCRGELARLAGAEIPSRYVNIPELADLSYDGFSEDMQLLIKSLSKTVVSVMIKHMLANKRRSFH
ncbi:MAG: hypothetical protein ACI4WS_02850 [Oscillospiraceae bacterium]